MISRGVINSVRDYLGQMIYPAGTKTAPSAPEMRMRVKANPLRSDPRQDCHTVLDPSQFEEQTAGDFDSDMLRYEALAHQIRLSSDRCSIRSIEKRELCPSYDSSYKTLTRHDTQDRAMNSPAGERMEVKFSCLTSRGGQRKCTYSGV